MITGCHEGMRDTGGSDDWQAIADASMDGIGVTVGETVVEANDAFATAVGFESRSDVVDSSWRELYPPETLERIDDEVLPTVRAGDRWRGELTWSGTDGTTVARRLSVRAIEAESVIWVVRDTTEIRERRRQLDRYRTMVETVQDGIYALDEAVRFTYVSDWFCELMDRDRAEIIGTHARAFYEDDDVYDEHADLRERLVEQGAEGGTIRATIDTPRGERILESRYRLHPEPADGEFRGSVGVIRDVTERLERERALQRQRDELATLDRINELLLETVRALLRTEGRDAVERTVCERLTADERYRDAWIGQRMFDGEEVVRRADGSTTGESREELPADWTELADEEGPIARALDAGEVRVADGDASVGPPDESVAAVPLRHDDHVHGVLVVHASNPDGFTDRERDGFGVLGRTVGFALHAARNRELLFADAVVELEFSLPDAETLLQETATALGCELTLDGYVAAGSRWVLYLEVDGAAPDAVCDATAKRERVERSRVMATTDDGGRVELVVTDSTLLDRVRSAGATVRSATVDHGSGRLTVEAPVEADARSLVDHVRTAFPGAAVVATAQRERPLTGVGRPGGLLDALTDRQREVLEAAYRGGYFAWPRESTAEAVADSLDISAPTLHAHLRKAEAAILARLLDAE